MTKRKDEKHVLADVDLQSLRKDTTKKNAVAWDNGDLGNVLLRRFIDQLNTFHSLEIEADKELEEILLKQQQYEIEQIGKEPSGQDPNIPRYSPSSVSKCMRELYFKYSNIPFEKDPVTVFPYHKRWTKNAQYIHMRVQHDILYSSKYVPDAPFKPYILPNGLPAWEKPVAKYKVLEHKGVKFALYGMTDGILKGTHENEEKLYLFEFKTKSTSIGAIGNYKLKSPQDSHLYQIQTYLILYDGIEAAIILYESLAKDSWMKGEEAKPDLKAFFVTPDNNMQVQILDKLARLTEYIENKEIPPKENDKCTFCPFKNACSEVGE